ARLGGGGTPKGQHTARGLRADEPGPAIRVRQASLRSVAYGDPTRMTEPEPPSPLRDPHTAR
ncbi:MAG TPA: hypothetical protein VIR33_06375, partial [Thermopolyspora sp.]